MTDCPRHLICHKVAGEKAYDVAIRMECPECHGDPSTHTCECDGLGYWWIIPTSGHRAHPVMHYPLAELVLRTYDTSLDSAITDLPVPDLSTVPDHYIVTASPRGATTDARPEFLRVLLRKPQITINRRGL